MTDNEIIKALECSPLNDIGGCRKIDALDLINRQKAEIEELRADNNYLFETMPHMKAEAIKEFAERLNARIRKDIDEQGMLPLPYTKKAYDTVKIFIDNLVKEMTDQ